MSEPADGPPADPKPDAPAADKKSADNPFAEMIRNPAARTYLLISAAGLAITATGLGLPLFYNSLIGAIVVTILGLAGLGLRWVIGPPGVAFATAWFMFMPLGLPIDLPHTGSMVPEHHFNVADLLTVAAALVHLIAAYRFHSVMRAGMPFDAPAVYVKPGAKPTVRPAVPVRDAELWFLFARVGLFVLVGQLLWLFATALKVDFRQDFPLRFYSGFMEEQGQYYGYGEIPNSISRFLLAVGAITGLSFAVWFALWYWRLAVVNRDEARAACLDTEWATNRREYNRPEKWRGWMKQKGATTVPKAGCLSWVLAILLVCSVPCLLSCLSSFMFGWFR